GRGWNRGAPWGEVMRAARRLGVVVTPATTLLTAEELADRVDRGRARMIVCDEDQVAKCRQLSRRDLALVTISDAPVAGWRSLGEVYASSDEFVPDGPTRAEDPLLLYFTSGTTARPKLVLH